MANCLVTGGAGFIGGHVADLLIEKGHEVTILDNMSTGKLDNINPIARLIEADITDKTDMQLLKSTKYDYVFHLAALARIQPSIKDPLTTHKTNVEGTLHILEYCRSSGAHLIFSGSSSIYKGDKLPTKEDDEKKPLNPYALQKLQAEQYIQIYSELYGTTYTILRYFNVYGERQILDGAYAAVVGILLDQKANDKSMSVTGDGEQRRDFTYVKDVAKANVMGMNWNGIFNIGNGDNKSINELTVAIRGHRHHLPEAENEVRATLADNTRAREQGWKPTMQIEDWIDSVVER